MNQKVLTVKELLEKKKLIDKQQDENFYSEVFGGEIEVSTKINKDDLLEQFLDESKGEYERYKEIIYMVCPIFKTEEIRAPYKGELDVPTDIIDKIFSDNMQEVLKLGNFILKRFGFLKESDLEKVKKR